jgi:hypothetical protein
MSDIASGSNSRVTTTGVSARMHVERDTMDRRQNPRVAAFRSMGIADASTVTAHSGVKRMRPQAAAGISHEGAMRGENTAFDSQRLALHASEEAEANHCGRRGSSELKQAEVPLEQAESVSRAKRPRFTLDADAAKRSKRMFGALLGHLSKAKTTLESEPEQRRIIQQQQQQAAALERDSKRRVQEVEAAAMTAWRVKEEAFQHRETTQLELQKSELTTLTDRLKRAVAEKAQAAASFLQTATLPAVFWRPAEPSKVFLDLLSKQRPRMEDECKRREADITEWMDGKFSELEKELARKRSQRRERSPPPTQAIVPCCAEPESRLEPSSDLKECDNNVEWPATSSEADAQPNDGAHQAVATVTQELTTKKVVAHEDDLLDYGHD